MPVLYPLHGRSWPRPWSGGPSAIPGSALGLTFSSGAVTSVLQTLARIPPASHFAVAHREGDSEGADIPVHVGNEVQADAAASHMSNSNTSARGAVSGTAVDRSVDMLALLVPRLPRVDSLCA